MPYMLDILRAGHNHDSVLEPFIRSLAIGDAPTWSIENVRPTLKMLIKHFNTNDVMEIGGGRRPLLDHNEVFSLGIRLAVNDIAQSELDLAPSALHKVCFDIGGSDLPEQEWSHYDLVFSRFVLEHVRDVKQAYVNTYALLRRGGLFFHVFPTLYAFPFLLNWILPEQISQVLLWKLKPPVAGHRVKFPAYYSYCKLTKSTIDMLEAIGFGEIRLIPFYGYPYLKRVPLVRDLDRAFNRFARLHALRLFSSYCYAFGRK